MSTRRRTKPASEARPNTRAGLSAREVGCSTHQFVDRLSAHVLGELLHPLRRAPHEMRELWRAAVKTVGGRVDGVGDVTHQVRAGRHLLREEALRPFIGVGRERRGGLLGLAAGLLRDVSELRDGFAGLGANALLRSRQVGSCCSYRKVVDSSVFSIRETKLPRNQNVPVLNEYRVDPDRRACALSGRSIATPMPRLDVPLFASSCHPVIGDDLRYEVAPLVGRSIKNQVIRKLFSPQPVPHRFFGS